MNTDKSETILVTYSSRAGSTAGVAKAIGQVLKEHHFNVDVLEMKDVETIESYQAVIAGSAIQAGKWLPEALQFVEKHKEVLNKKPVAIFAVCMTLAMAKGETYRPTVSEWLQPVSNMIKPVSEGLFAGALNISKIPSFSDRFKFRTSVLFGTWKVGDHRDWGAIQTWAKDLKNHFQQLNIKEKS